MIGIDKKTGELLKNWDQCAARIEQVLTTPLGARPKRPLFGSRVRYWLNHATTNTLLVRIQAACLSALGDPNNGLQDFTPIRVKAKRQNMGTSVTINGIYHDASGSNEQQLQILVS